ncbi:two-component system response regulator [Cellvibrio zantedeschiae]|uniref:Two-component system response regulator n=1 Tax=Cellvibrio zantedeschiae TaxID=1237077 RepID=A0ABQ3B817_9GAMM|nr:response regulator [Cellvibrio zantedeschiae]GGY83055.1 two-component system response regulator [Cellvibrio zantedeschiae]
MALKILVADDATFIRDMIKKQLRDRIPGVEIFDAADGARALALFKQNDIDMILSDWEMPLMTGEEFLRNVRSSPNGAKTPFVMISSRGDRDHIVKAIQSGVSDYLSKPFSAEELLRKVYKQLKVLGKLPSSAAPRAATQGIAAASIDVLTAGRVEAVAPKAAAAAGNGSAALLTGSPLLTAKPVVAAVKSTPKAQAQLRFSDNRIFACVIREMSLQLMSCALQRTEKLPSLFEQAVVDIDMGEGNGLARVNGYVHSIIAGENRPDSSTVKMVIRFVDNDAEKFEVLSKFISQM